jgi:hypothetical protein
MVRTSLPQLKRGVGCCIMDEQVYPLPRVLTELVEGLKGRSRHHTRNESDKALGNQSNRSQR